MSSRACISCSRSLPRSSYTANQYSRGEGDSCCAACVHSHRNDTPTAIQSDSGRYNRANEAKFTQNSMANPFVQGAFRWVAKGAYVDGGRQGQACVCKWFKAGGTMDSDYFTLDIKSVDKALEIINHFNQLNILNKTVKVNVPEVWVWGGNNSRAGQKSLVEPFIQNYKKFNSNSGWTDESKPWALAMQALSHFSYHISGGNFVLCDLQGGIYQNEVVLTDPVILSPTQQYGVTDLGPNGISSFFSQHVCNEHCRPTRTAPHNPVRHLIRSWYFDDGAPCPDGWFKTHQHTVLSLDLKKHAAMQDEPWQHVWPLIARTKATGIRK